MGRKLGVLLPLYKPGYSSLAECIQYYLPIVFKLYFICFKKLFKPLRTEFSPLYMLDVYTWHTLQFTCARFI